MGNSKQSLRYPFTWPFPPDTSKYAKIWSCSSTIALTSVTLFSKIWLTKLNNAKLYMSENLHHATRDRTEDVALVTVSNHFSCLDDPLLWGCLKWREIFTPSRLRWSLAADDICFTKKWHGTFFSLGRIVPVVRGGGVYQRGMDFVLDKLNQGHWLHIFPEGRVNMEKEFIRLKWGVGRLISECQRRVIVLPFYHVGMDDVLPNRSPYIPRIGKKVTVLFGSPIEFGAHIAKWKGMGWTTERIRKEITDTIQDELEKLKPKAYKLHNSDLS